MFPSFFILTTTSLDNNAKTETAVKMAARVSLAPLCSNFFQFLVIHIMPMDFKNTTLTLPSSSFQLKYRPKEAQNHENRVLYFGHMASLTEMVKNSLYQLEILSIFCFIGRWPTWTLEASADPSFSALIFPLKPLSVRQP